MTDAPPPPPPRTGSGFALFVACAALVATLLLVTIRLRPPAPLGADAPADVFSEARARDHLRALVPDDAPRPLGSDAHRRTRETLVARFRAAGLDVETERRWVAVPTRGSAGWVENVIARLPGEKPGPAILVAAHYDSVGAGPGAADDAMSVAAMLEVARIVRASGKPPCDVVFLVTDGEEVALLGAYAHMHGRSDAYRCALNFEGRGNAGPSLLFETQADAPYVAAWARHAARPTGSSVFVEVYRQMPNDTDFTVFRNEALPGLNFACIGRVQHYHTPRDSVEHLDPATLQHHGENMLAAVRGAIDVAAASVPGETVDSVVFFDVLGACVVRWPLGGTIPLAVVTLSIVVAAVVLRLRRTELRGREVLVGVAAWTLAVAAGAGAAWGAQTVLGMLGALDLPFVAEPAWSVAAYAAAALWAASFVMLALTRWTSAPGVWCAGALWTSLAGIAAATTYPRGAYLLVAPVLLAGVVGLVQALRRRDGVTAEGLTLLTASAVVLGPLAIALSDALGVGPGLVHGAVWILVVLPLLPFLAGAGRRAAAVTVLALVTLAGGIFLAARAPLATPALPAPLTFVYRQEAGMEAASVVLLGDTPPTMLALVNAEGPERPALPWKPRERGLVSAVADAALAMPAVEDLRTVELDAGRRVSFRLRSARGATTLWLVLDPKARLRSVTVRGTKGRPVLFEGVGYVLRFVGVPAEGVEVAFDAADATPVLAWIADATPGLPPSCLDFVRLRPGARVPWGEGDRSVCLRRLRL